MFLPSNCETLQIFQRDLPLVSEEIFLTVYAGL